MVSKNPLFGRWSANKFAATVLDDIWPEVTFFTLVATIVTVVSLKTSVDLGISNQLLNVLGLVLSLVISFRTSSAYEKYQDGGKMWTNIIVASKNMAQLIWFHVPADRNPPPGLPEARTTLQVAIEKKTMINLIQAFAVSVKHFLRGEDGPYYTDLYPLISFLPRYADGVNGLEKDLLPLWYPRSPEFDSEETPRNENTRHNRNTDSMTYRPEDNDMDREAFRSQLGPNQILKPARNPPHISIHDYFPFIRFFRWIIDKAIRSRPRSRLGYSTERNHGRKEFSKISESHIPFEILLVLSKYSTYLLNHNLITAPTASGIAGNILSLTDTLSNLERMCNNPLPFAYQVHLHMSVWSYLFTLPFQMYPSYGAITIPATAFAAFLLIGFLEIGQQIENPFDYDMNSLDLDYICFTIKRDLAGITASTADMPFENIFSKLNTPFAPGDVRPAEELIMMDLTASNSPEVPGKLNPHKVLLQGWKNIIARDK